MQTGFEGMGKMFMLFGGLLLLFGLALTYSGKVLGHMGGFRLPGDIVIRRGNFTLYFPLMTSILLSLALTIIGWLIAAGRR